MKYNFDGKLFVSIANTENGEVGEDTVFHYHQDGDIVTAEYEGGSIAKGQLIAKVRGDGKLDMRYHHINCKGELMIGKCLSTPEIMEDGRMKLKEQWQWLSGDMSAGYSEIVETDSI
ncbi:MAG: n-acetylglutamate synthase [Geobacteraceae bacterium]|nr:n-acetylglutamate synthase [Geobacteraceae bacterium]